MNFYPGKNGKLVAGGIILGMIVLFVLVSKDPNRPDSGQSAIRTTAYKEGYDAGYAKGYEVAKEENNTAYKRGYNTAQKEIGSGALTRNGILGFLSGFTLGLGLVIVMKKKEFSEGFQAFKKRRELRRAFRTIPANLPPDVNAIARQIARVYVNVLAQIRMSKGYTIDLYARRWTSRLDELMQRALRLMELIKELELSKAQIDELELAKTIKELQHTVKSMKTDDTARNTAAKSLQRARQTQKDLIKTRENLEHCKTSLQGITGMLESMHLKISNLKVNSKETETLEELSSDLESEMSAIEEALMCCGNMSRG